MPVTAAYDPDHKLILRGFECDCPCSHTFPDLDIYLGEGLLDDLPRIIRKRIPGARCVLVTDAVLYPLYGQRVQAILAEAGFCVTLCVIKRDGVAEPDERTCGEILLSISPDTEFILSVGSGTMTDAARINAARCALPFVVVGTAPSMDGYTSSISPLLLRGVKTHRDAVCPDIIICDLDVLRSAPSDMVASGAGDVLGKLIADADYRLGHIINDEPYCHTCGDLSRDAAHRILYHAREIRSRSAEGIRILTEALLLTGLTIKIIGHTRCAASVEHNMAHYWEMMQLYAGVAAPAHGASVGVATLMVLPLFKRFIHEDPSNIHEDAVIGARLPDDRIRKRILLAYGSEAGHTLMAENPQVFLDEDTQRARIRRVKERFGEIQAVFQQLPETDLVRGALTDLGAPLTAEALGVGKELRDLSMHFAADYRPRYTLLKTLRECGLTDKYLADYVIHI
jgi:glycerol-1-phosphate dehydrogenase [NAD(P)+]